jgi:hypothetical protein
MPSFPFTPASLVVAVITVAGCAGGGSPVQAGLANAASISRFSRSDPQAPHDPVSNGGESCPRSARGSSPLRGRIPPCPSASARSSPAPRATKIERSSGPWTEPWFPSRGMDPCAEWTATSWQLTVRSELSPALCETACAPSLFGCAAGRRRQP